MSMDNLLSETLTDPLPAMVLLVEGEADTLETHACHLESAGLWVTTATNPTDGLRYVREFLPNLLVADVTLADGVDLVHAVKQDIRTTHIPIVVLTVQPVDDLSSATRSEVDAVLQQPVRPELLYSRSRRLIANSALLRNRSHAALERAYLLLQQNRVGRQRGGEYLQKLRWRVRACPGCGTGLEWLERTTVAGIEYDYYGACPGGCGLYCFDRRFRQWITLSGQPDSARRI
jgi:CheY-like chemotaxis protein